MRNSIVFGVRITVVSPCRVWGRGLDRAAQEPAAVCEDITAQIVGIFVGISAIHIGLTT